MEFYTEDRFRNWINRIAESEVDLEKSESLNVFDQLLEDFTIACLNVVRAVKEREISKKEAMRELDEMSKFVLASVDFGDEIKNELFEFTRESIKAVIYSTKMFLEGKVSKKDFKTLLNDAVKREMKGDLRGAFETVARMGAKVLKGERLPDDLEPPGDGFVVNWLDGVEMIDVVMRLNEIDSGDEA